MNYSGCMKENPGGLAVAIQEWWHALTGDQGRISASRDLQNSSPNAAFLSVINYAVVQWCLGCLLVVCGVAAIALRLAEVVNSPWVIVSLVLKVVSWL
jgi:hypothetical protein